MNFKLTSKVVIVKDVRAMTADELKQWKKYWKNFHPYEVCTRDFSIRISIKAMTRLQALREEHGKKMFITCGCRNWAHNQAVGGKRNSDHLTEDDRGRVRDASGFDIAVGNTDEGRQLEALAKKHGFNAIGRYPGQLFIHIGIRKPKPNGRIYQWGSWYRQRKVKHV